MTNPVRYIIASLIVAVMIAAALAGFQGFLNPPGILLAIGLGISGLYKLFESRTPSDKEPAPGE
ncbi:hypothetical protein GCM10009555_067440 [Acrocarpospora macrocephala]|uniref:Uncharacterized protein n=1 Tax=Acrocarpospora macrocephala TaxID=150177 RepID=A0A5M3WM53_9ACTN|nr:hypothetical protein [Acrocarpospora macrocephala]GES09239.1 hypothetical protein Amac_028350 [Acrocarpospora macrocephala]